VAGPPTPSPTPPSAPRSSRTRISSTSTGSNPARPPWPGSSPAPA
jgi:hypothetical protein